MIRPSDARLPEAARKLHPNATICVVQQAVRDKLWHADAFVPYHGIYLGAVLARTERLARLALLVALRGEKP